MQLRVFVLSVVLLVSLTRTGIFVLYEPSNLFVPLRSLRSQSHVGCGMYKHVLVRFVELRAWKVKCVGFRIERGRPIDRFPVPTGLVTVFNGTSPRDIRSCVFKCFATLLCMKTETSIGAPRWRLHKGTDPCCRIPCRHAPVPFVRLVIRFSRAIKDFNETRASDVFVVNFGAHYHETPEGDRDFKDAVLPMLDEMAEIGKTATVVWRYVSYFEVCVCGAATRVMLGFLACRPFSRMDDPYLRYRKYRWFCCSLTRSEAFAASPRLVAGEHLLCYPRPSCFLGFLRRLLSVFMESRFAPGKSRRFISRRRTPPGKVSMPWTAKKNEAPAAPERPLECWPATRWVELHQCSQHVHRRQRPPWVRPVREN